MMEERSRLVVFDNCEFEICRGYSLISTIFTDLVVDYNGSWCLEIRMQVSQTIAWVLD